MSLTPVVTYQPRAWPARQSEASSASVNWPAVALVGALTFYLPNRTHFPGLLSLGLFNPTNILTGALLFLWLGVGAENQVKTPIHKALRLFFGVSLISLFLGVLHSSDVRGDITAFWRFTTSVLLFFLAYGVIRTEQEIKWSFLALLFTTACIGLELSREGILTGENFSEQKRASGPFGEGWAGSDVAGAFMAQFSPFLLAAALWARRLAWRLCAGWAYAVCGVGLLGTYSRASLGAVVVATLLVLYLKGKKWLLLGLAASMLLLPWLPGSISSRLEMSTEDDPSISGRFGFWMAAGDLVSNNPLGVGYNHVWEAMGKTLPAGSTVDPHNGYLYALVESGIPGFLAFAFLLIAMFRLLRRAHRAAAPGMHKAITSGAAGMFVSLLMVNMAYSNFFRDMVQPIIWVGFALAGAVLRLENSNRSVAMVLRENAPGKGQEQWSLRP